MLTINETTNKKLIKTTGIIFVNKSVESVFDIFANPGNDNLWRTEINKSTVKGVLQSGVTIAEYSYLSKKAPDNLVELKCIQYEKDKFAIFETLDNAQFYLKSERYVKAIADNKTEIMYALTFDMEIVKHALGFALPKFIVLFKAGSDMKKYLRQLKTKLDMHV